MSSSAVPPNPGELLNRFAERHWNLAARHAWRMYNERGRGAVVFRSNADGERGRKLPLNYLTFKASKEETMGTQLEIVRHLIDTYDPEKEAVLAINFRDGTTVVDVYKKEPAPPDCAVQNGHSDEPARDAADTDMVDSPEEIEEVNDPDGARGDGAAGDEPGFDDQGNPLPPDAPDDGPGDEPGGDDDDHPDLPDFLGDDPDGGALA